MFKAKGCTPKRVQLAELYGVLFPVASSNPELFNTLPLLKLCEQSIVGASVSFTVISTEQVAVKPALSTTVQLTVVVPNG